MSSEVKRSIELIEDSFFKDVKQIKDQSDCIKNEIGMVVNQEIKKMNNLMQPQIQKLEREYSDLQTFTNNWKTVQEKGTVLLDK